MVPFPCHADVNRISRHIVKHGPSVQPAPPGFYSLRMTDTHVMLDWFHNGRAFIRHTLTGWRARQWSRHHDIFEWRLINSELLRDSARHTQKIYHVNEVADEWISVPCLSYQGNLHAIIASVYCFTSVHLPPATGGVLWIACGVRVPIYIYKLFNQCSQLGNKLLLLVLLIN